MNFVPNSVALSEITKTKNADQMFAVIQHWQAANIKLAHSAYGSFDALMTKAIANVCGHNLSNRCNPTVVVASY